MRSPTNHYILTLAALLLLCFVPGASAQGSGADTTDAWRYFPLEVGNKWEYSIGEFNLGTVDSTKGYIRYSDTDIDYYDDKAYHIVKREMFDSAGYIIADSVEYYSVRFDTLSSRLLERDENGVEYSWPLGFPCSFDADFGSFVECDHNKVGSVTGNYNLVVQIGNDSIITSRKTYDVTVDGTIVPKWTYEYGSDVGLSYYKYEVGNLEFTWYQTEYALVGGVEYGEPIPILVAAAPPPVIPSSVRLEQTMPNPARDATALSFVLPEPAHVRLAVLDLLGREVARLVDEARAAGRHRVRLETDGLPVGLYVYRLEAAGEVRTRTMAVVR